jgi:hypothetical protein
MIVTYTLMVATYAYVMIVGIINLFKEKSGVVECLEEYATGE